MKPVEFFKDKNKQWHFRVVATNGRILCSSEAYTTRAKARKGVKSIHRNIGRALKHRIC